MANSINMLVYGVGAIFVGIFVDLVHPKKMLSIGILFLSMGLIGCSQIRSLWQFYIGFGVVLALGICSLGVVVHSKLLAQWFKRNLGSVLGRWLG